MLNYPTICFVVLPEAEQEYGRLIWENLISLGTCVQRVAEAIELAEFCDASRAKLGIGAYDERTKFINWKHLAAGAAAINVANYHETRQVLDGQVKHCPTILDNLDQALLGEGRKIFDDAFPNFANIRLAVAHKGRLNRKPEEAARHVMPGGGRVGFAISDNQLWTSVGGKGAGFSLSRKSLETLEFATSGYFAGYERAANITCALHDEQMRQKHQPPSQD